MDAGTDPKKIKLSEYNSDAILTPRAALDRGMTTICEKVDVKIMKDQTNRKFKADVSFSSCAGMFLFIPRG